MNIDSICRILSKIIKIKPNKSSKKSIRGSFVKKIEKIGIMKTPRRYGK